MTNLLSSHSWNLTAQQARKIQEQLRPKVELTPLSQPINTIGGADISFERGSDIGYAGIVVFEYPSLEKIEHRVTKTKLEFPYIPGLLAFREIPPLAKAWEQLSESPDVLMLDGHGLAHPRQMGIATHFGLLADIPTLGCAKKVLVGHYEEPAPEAGSYTYLYNDEEQVLGAVLRTRTNVKPVFISVGHQMTLENALDIARHCRSGYKVPTPTRQAHLLVNKAREGQILLSD